VSAVFERAVEAFAPLRDRYADLDFAVEADAGLPRVLVDVPAMADAVGNLLHNALKYGGSPPRIRLRGRLDPKGVVLEVSDNGDGIPRREHRRIFYKFYRIDDRLSREREGSGLGLAIVKHIIRAHHGRITLESHPGKGSVFRIVLPAAPAGAPSPVGASAQAKTT
jgi:two-component system phosphate regulon sensor histidine kinase PhoR